MNMYTPGALVQCMAVFSDPVSHEMLEPNGVAAEVKDPTGAVTTPDVSLENDRSSLRRFVIRIDTTGVISGVWSYRFTSPNPTQAAQEGSFLVTSSAF